MSATTHQVEGSGSWLTTIAGWGMSAWGWLVADMPGITILLTLATLALTVVNLASAVRKFRRDRTPGKSRLRRVRDSITGMGGL